MEGTLLTKLYVPWRNEDIKKKKTKQNKKHSSFSLKVSCSELLYIHDHINLQILLQIIPCNIWHPLIVL